VAKRRRRPLACSWSVHEMRGTGEAASGYCDHLADELRARLGKRVNSFLALNQGEPHGEPPPGGEHWRALNMQRICTDLSLTYQG